MYSTMRDQVGQLGSAPYSPYHRAKITDIFVCSIALFRFLFCATQFSLNEGMSMTFQTYSMVLPITD